ncbi:hypothetical protein SprV_0301144200 [Sparganum proliferum]
MMARATGNGKIYGTFAVRSVVGGGRMLTLTLFILMFSAMLLDAYREDLPGVGIDHQTNGKQLNIHRLKASWRVSKARVHDMLFTDDCVLNITTGGGIQRTVDLFASGCSNVSLAIDKKNVVVLQQPTPTADSNKPCISAGRTHFIGVDKLASGGNIIPENINAGDAIVNRNSRSSQAFCRPNQSVWTRRCTLLNTKLRMYTAVIMKVFV